ncbi:MAG: SBBP repeat-containing protein [Pirellulaceae bacterium]|nr:SBBP repeat-containing protein [Pirellulaceae bacterium]
MILDRHSMITLGRVLVAVAVLTSTLVASLAESYELGFSTYIGGSGEGQVRDVTVDQHGNVYISGGTSSADFPRTVGQAHQGSYDVFVVKYDKRGQLIWSRLLGGPNYDRAYAVEVDEQGYVYLGGRAGPGYPTTPNAVQPQFGGDSNPNALYGLQDGFVTKLSPDGTQVVWSTFFGGNDRGFFRDIDIDDMGNVYGALCANSVVNPHITLGAYFTNRPSSPSFGIVTKISSDGTDVIWASYLGGQDGGYSFGTPSIRVDDQGYVVVASHTASASMPTTSGAYDRVKNGNSDMHIAKFLPDGSDLVFATYLGGSDIEYGDTHNLALDANGDIIVAATTKSADFPVTSGSFQSLHGGNGGQYSQLGDGFIARLSPDGSRLLAATFYGGSSGEGLEGVGVDSEGNIYVSGGTYSTNLPVAGSLFGPNSIGSGRPDAFVAKFSADLSKLIFGTCIGGSNWDLGLTTPAESDGALYLAGETKSSDFPTGDAVDNDLSGTKNGILVRIDIPPSTLDRNR